MGVPAPFSIERGAYTPTSNSSPQGGGEAACAIVRTGMIGPERPPALFPPPCGEGWGGGAGAFFDERGAYTPTSNSSPQRRVCPFSAQR